jgi:3-dehydroquinate dehydratase II
MAKFLVVHGAGMNMRGKTQIDVFGPMTLADYDAKIRGYAAELGVAVDIFHSNIEGDVINIFYAAQESEVDGAVINPAGFMSGYPALAAAITQVTYPTIEVHISNPARRGTESDISSVVRGVIAGFGVYGYYLALRSLKEIAAGK